MQNKFKNRKYTISISGAAEVTHCGAKVIEKAFELGRAIATNDFQLATGATTGFPYYVNQGYKEIGGFVFGLSPASTRLEHVSVYNLPDDYVDAMIYTGFGFPGRDMMLVRSSDAIIIGCGRIGTIHEFTIAWESEIPVGILEGAWATDEVIKEVIEKSGRTNSKVIFDSDPVNLVRRIKDMLESMPQDVKRPFQAIPPSYHEEEQRG